MLIPYKVLFVVVNGVPSIGVQVMVGSGQVGEQPTNNAVALPPPSVATQTDDGQSSGSSSQHTTGNQDHNAAMRTPLQSYTALLVSGLLSVSLLAALL